MNPGVKKMLAEQTKLAEIVRSLPALTFGTVVSASPLTVHLDGDYDDDENPIATPAISMVGPVSEGHLAVCMKKDRRVFVIAASSL